MAIYRKCKYCGAPLSLREMPAGQWVAFDFGTDIVHQCRLAEAQVAKADAMAWPSSNDRSKAGSRPRSGASTRSQASTRNRSRRSAAKALTADARELATEYTAILRLLERAIAERRCVWMRYYTAYRQDVTERVVEPTSLTPAGSGYILEAYCHFRGEYRSFAVGNIRRAQLLNETFTPRPRARGTPEPHYTGPPANRERGQLAERPTEEKAAASAAVCGCLLPILIALLVLILTALLVA
ncbi:conserved domain protein [Symbiobacterium thermophilum IAM 14863]|uniref:Conserved domain protein n=2 Tax=Symbiobacterium thermophilum TaxID=2734 RepID=Q67PV7_SYMTH|nr:conserved domain protein [Symbiobacterium thermophilum IAM 14863]